VAELLLSYYSKDKISKECAKFLYSGIMTDTNFLFYPCASVNTLAVVSVLFDILGEERSKINNSIRAKDLEQLKLENTLTKKVK
jgi:nanoRNase/pAp phosphatase (c-di-AMP/oligoRNAs hydrolase)